MERFSKPKEVITDKVTTLQWRVGPDSNTSLLGAKDWVASLGGDWRMPTLSELKGLWDAGISDEAWGYLENSGSFVWSGEAENPPSWWCIFDFNTGDECWGHRSLADACRAFAVRATIE